MTGWWRVLLAAVPAALVGLSGAGTASAAPPTAAETRGGAVRIITFQDSDTARQRSGDVRPRMAVREDHCVSPGVAAARAQVELTHYHGVAQSYGRVLRVAPLNSDLSKTPGPPAGSAAARAGTSVSSSSGGVAAQIGPHIEKIADVAGAVSDGRVIAGGQTGRPEAVIRTSGDMKGSRRPDILVERADGSMYANVGTQSPRTGAPMTREVQAINDLEEFGGRPMQFVPYN